jgi:hypothetical protein
LHGARATTGPRVTTQGLGKNYAESPFSVAAFVANSEPHNGARPSLRVCVGLARDPVAGVYVFDADVRNY